MTDETRTETRVADIDVAPPRPRFEDLPPAAQRALKEAEERRRIAAEAAAANLPTELQGRGGPEPVRYGDWEIKGIACDF